MVSLWTSNTSPGRSTTLPCTMACSGSGLGGSGVAILRFPSSYYITEVTGSNVQSFLGVGGYNVYKFNAPGAINFGNPSAYG